MAKHATYCWPSHASLGDPDPAVFAKAIAKDIAKPEYSLAQYYQDKTVLIDSDTKAFLRLTGNE